MKVSNFAATTLDNPINSVSPSPLFTKNHNNNVAVRDEDQDYVCYCSAITKIIALARLTGVMPLVPIKHLTKRTQCKFRVSSGWVIYSIILQVLYGCYMGFMYYSRLSCGSGSQSSQQWYVMSLGYFFTDLDSFFTLIFGAAFAKRNACLLEFLSLVPVSVKVTTESVSWLRKRLHFWITCSMLFCAAVTGCHIFVACHRWTREFSESFHCTMSDRPFAILLRGATAVFPTVHIGVVMMFILLIKSKFILITESTKACIIKSQYRPEIVTTALGRLSEMHKDLTNAVAEFNQTMGVQVLVAISSSLFNSIYYLYRYNTATASGVTSNYHDRIHYIVGLLFRIGKLLAYMTLGQILNSSSAGPLEVLQAESLIQMPGRLQQQVQTLILQWQGHKNIFSAVNVINVGPWLLAPIVGNVITYLLVALQFKSGN